jgi:K+-sensing histidine kinase KdpD
MKYSLYDVSRKEVARNFLPNCDLCFSSVSLDATVKKKCPSDGQQRRLGILSISSEKVSLCSPLEEDLNSTRIFRSRMKAYVDVLQYIRTIRSEFNQSQKRLLHNLTSLNAHCIQEVYDLVPQDTLTKNFTQQLQIVQNTLSASPEKAARVFLRIAKNNLAMKSEFAVMRLLDEINHRPQLREHSIQKVVLNILHVFFQDFTERRVHVTVQDSPVYVLIDYDTFSVALYHVIDNATKYIMPRSELMVFFEATGERVNVVFDMFSLAISKEELPRIGEEGFSGNLPRALQLAGNGLGIFRTRKFLALNNGNLLIKSNVTPSRTTKDKGIEYNKNQFIITLNATQNKGRTPTSPK